MFSARTSARTILEDRGTNPNGAHLTRQLDILVKKNLPCEHVHKNVFYSQFEPAEQDRILRINIGTSFGFKFSISKFSKIGAICMPLRNKEIYIIYIYIYIYISLLCRFI